MERWKAIRNAPNYDVSDYGRVLNPRTGRILKPGISVRGYPNVILYVNEYRLSQNVHQLVARAFVPGEFPGAEINHKDGNKTNNHFSNLEWTTRSGNQLHAYRTGLKVAGNKNPVRIIELDKVFPSVVAAANYIDGDHSTISKILRENKQIAHKGFTFEYVD